MIRNDTVITCRRVQADPRLALLRAWLSLGVLVLLLTPVSAWHSHSIGWLPYWCVVAPSLSLALLRRRAIVAALAVRFAPVRRRRLSRSGFAA